MTIPIKPNSEKLYSPSSEVLVSEIRGLKIELMLQSFSISLLKSKAKMQWIYCTGGYLVGFAGLILAVFT